MTIELPPPLPQSRPVSAIHEDIDLVIRSMQPGLYVFADLYDAYCRHVRTEERRPASRLSFGQRLARDGRIESSRTDRVRFIALADDEVARRKVADQ